MPTLTAGNDPSNPGSATQKANYTKRARLSAKPAAKELVYGPASTFFGRQLRSTNGLLFPYTPTISDTATVNYDVYEPVHGNQNFSAFRNRASKEIQVVGTFTSMNQPEARANLAYLHFLRTITQMYFGTQSENRGTPPPILLFNAYGSAVFNNVPVIVTNYNYEMPTDVDYVYINTEKTNPIAAEFSGGDLGGEFNTGPAINGFDAWVPTRFSISIQMTVQNTPARLRREFDLDKFRRGDLINGGGWI